MADSQKKGGKTRVVWPGPAPTDGGATASLSQTDPTSSDTHAPIEGSRFGRGELIGRHIVIDEVGRGGMGVVLSAYDTALDRKVALKVLRDAAGDSPDEQGRLLREAQAMARLSHPNIVAVHDVGEVSGATYIVMEFVDGCTLKEWLRSAKRSTGEILRVFSSAGQGLWAAHQAGLVHRDFKPSNVLIDRTGQPRVTDFGLVSILSITEPGVSSSECTSIAGTPGYMSPEQLKGGTIDERTDQFSFCVALYEALEGKRPHRGRTFDACTRALLSGQLAEPDAKGDFPAWVWPILQRGLEIAPSARYPSMEDLLHALGQSPDEMRLRAVTTSALSFFSHSRMQRGEAEEAALALNALLAEAREKKNHSKEAEALVHLVFVKSRLQGRFDDAKDLLTEAELAVGRSRWSPALAAQLHDARGALFYELGRFEEASQEHGRALSVLATAQLQTTGDAAVFRHNRGGALQMLGRFEDAREEHERALAIAQSLFGESHPLVANIHDGLGMALMSQGHIDRALPHMNKALDLARRQLGLRHPEVAKVLNNIGALRVRQGRHSMAKEHYQQALEIALAGGRQNRDTAATYNNLAGVFLVEGEMTQARAHAEEGRSIRAHIVGERHPEHASSLEMLGRISLKQGRFEEALELFLTAVQILEEHGPSSALAMAHNNVGAALMGLGRDEAGAAELKAALVMIEELLGLEHIHNAVICDNLAELYQRQGHHRQAFDHFDRAARIRGGEAGYSTKAWAESLAKSADMARHLGDVDTAAKRYDQALEALDSAPVPSWLTLGNAINGRAECFLELGETEEARKLFLRTAGFGADTPIYNRAWGVFGLARCQRASGKDEEAKGLAAEARELFARLGEDGAATLEQIELWWAETK